MADVPHGLPLGLPDFIGRAREIAEIAQLVVNSRVVTLTGPSGIGKTRLAIEVATRLHDSYPGGAWFVDLAPVPTQHSYLSPRPQRWGSIPNQAVIWPTPSAPIWQPPPRW